MLLSHRTPLLLSVSLSIVFIFACRTTSQSGVKDDDGSNNGQPSSTPPVTYLNQGWTDAQRQFFYTADQGSALVPYNWFVALEAEGTTDLFRSDANIRSYNYVPNAASAQNPDALPIGFAKAAGPDGQGWMGFTCAACHTSELTYQGQRLRVDGGATLADHMRLRSDLLAALQQTHDDDIKFQRFAQRLNIADQASLKTQLGAFVDSYGNRLRRSLPDPNNLFGPARVDAFGIELNEFLGSDLGVEANFHQPAAPVSYPTLWNSPNFDWVEWNGVSKVPLERNIGEAVGVFGQVNLTDPAKMFTSSANFTNLYQIEKTLQALQPPAWPVAFGALDSDKVKAGQLVYEANCHSCHAHASELTAANANGHSYIKTTMTPLETIGTDPTFVAELLGRQAQTGPLAGLKISKPGDPVVVLQATEPAAKMLKVMITAIQSRYFQTSGLTPAQILDYRNYATGLEASPNLQAYIARPLEGIWSSPPYLHNGSVPTLDDLLQPAGSRPKSFYLGGTEYDPSKAGLVTTQSDVNNFLFDTSLKNNSNVGHEYGTSLSVDDHANLLQYLKSI